MTLGDFVNKVLRTYMHERGLDIQWNQIAAITSATIGGNITLSGGRTTLAGIDLADVNDLAQSVTDQLGKAFTPLEQTPDPGKDRNANKYPSLGNERF